MNWIFKILFCYYTLIFYSQNDSLNFVHKPPTNFIWIKTSFTLVKNSKISSKKSKLKSLKPLLPNSSSKKLSSKSFLQTSKFPFNSTFHNLFPKFNFQTHTSKTYSKIQNPIPFHILFPSFPPIPSRIVPGKEFASSDLHRNSFGSRRWSAVHADNKYGP